MSNTKLDRIMTANPLVGICHMQVCAEADVTDEEILAHCNSKNPSGTSLGWTFVIRHGDGAPVQCASHHGRTHFMVGC